jgi:hypothetical protein
MVNWERRRWEALSSWECGTMCKVEFVEVGYGNRNVELSVAVSAGKSRIFRFKWATERARGMAGKVMLPYGGDRSCRLEVNELWARVIGGETGREMSDIECGTEEVC